MKTSGKRNVPEASFMSIPIRRQLKTPKTQQTPKTAEPATDLQHPL
jgi:hypothetical protein